MLRPRCSFSSGRRDGLDVLLLLYSSSPCIKSDIPLDISGLSNAFIASSSSLDVKEELLLDLGSVSFVLVTNTLLSSLFFLENEEDRESLGDLIGDFADFDFDVASATSTDGPGAMLSEDPAVTVLVFPFTTLPFTFLLLSDLGLALCSVSLSRDLSMRDSVSSCLGILPNSSSFCGKKSCHRLVLSGVNWNSLLDCRTLVSPLSSAVFFDFVGFVPGFASSSKSSRLSSC